MVDFTIPAAQMKELNGIEHQMRMLDGAFVCGPNTPYPNHLRPVGRRGEHCWHSRFPLPVSLDMPVCMLKAVLVLCVLGCSFLNGI